MKKIKVTNELMKKLLPFWKELRALEDEFYDQVADIERDMELETGIKGIEFFQGHDSGFFGIGNFDKTLPLIHDMDLDKVIEEEK